MHVVFFPFFLIHALTFHRNARDFAEIYLPVFMYGKLFLKIKFMLNFMA